MGFSLSPPLTDFYVSYREDVCIDFNSDITPKFYSRYIDDVSESDDADSKHFVLLPFKMLSLQMKLNLYNNDVKVTFSTVRNLYSLVRPLDPPIIDWKYLQANVVYQYKLVLGIDTFFRY